MFININLRSSKEKQKIRKCFLCVSAQKCMFRNGVGRIGYYY